jgi:hypothetical protein
MQQIKNIQGVAKHNGYIVIALIDKVGNMIIENEDGTLSHIDDVPEHEDNLQQISMMQNFVIDNIEYNVRKGGVKHKYNYLIDSEYDGPRINVSDSVTRYPKSGLVRILRNHEIYKRENLFFCGGSEFLKQVLPYIDSVMLTVIDHDYTNEVNVVDKFPIEEYSKHFRNKKSYISDTARVIKKTGEGMAPDTREVTILNDYFKLIRKVEKVKGTSNFYKFVTFTR